MSTITVFGITGYAGAAIAAELLDRGHRVIGVARDVSAVADRDGLTTIAGGIADPALVSHATQGADAVVVAVPALSSGLAAALPGLLSTAQEAGLRLGVMGGAGSLKISENGPRVIDTPEFPDAFKPEASAQAAVLDGLRSSDTPVDWFYISPAAQFGAHNPGTRTGMFRRGGDVVLADSDGESSISAQDLAIAFADELEHPAHHRERFTVAY